MTNRDTIKYGALKNSTLILSCPLTGSLPVSKVLDVPTWGDGEIDSGGWGIRPFVPLAARSLSVEGDDEDEVLACCAS